MRKERQSKYIIIFVLCFCVLFLTVGFAAFSNTLKINSNVIISPDETTFNVVFSTDSDSISDEYPICSSNNGAIVDTSLISIEKKEIKGLNAKFVEPGQSLTCTFYTHNIGKYVAYLNKISFNIVDEDGSFKKCTPLEGTTSSEVDKVCNNITFNIAVSGLSGLVETTDTEETNIGHTLNVGNKDKVEITITYTGTDRADGDFLMEFGTVQLLYETISTHK